MLYLKSVSLSRNRYRAPAETIIFLPDETDFQQRNMQRFCRIDLESINERRIFTNAKPVVKVERKIERHKNRDKYFTIGKTSKRETNTESANGAFPVISRSKIQRKIIKSRNFSEVGLIIVSCFLRHRCSFDLSRKIY